MRGLPLLWTSLLGLGVPAAAGTTAWCALTGGVAHPAGLAALAALASLAGLGGAWRVLVVERASARASALVAAATSREAELDRSLRRYAEELDRTRQRVEVLSALHHVVAAVSDAVDFRSILGEVTAVVARLVDAREVAIYLRDRGTGALRVGAHRVGEVVRFDREVDPGAVDLAGVQRVVDDSVARSRAGAAWERVGAHVACVVLLEANREPIGAVRVVVPSPDGDAAALDGLEEAVREVTEPVALAVEKPSLYDRAVYDPLTRMFNKRHYLEEAPRRFETARRAGSALALVMLDIDHFKRVNDTWGHETGDRVLAGVAEVVRRSVRSIDLPFRYGGEEMCLLLPEAGAAEAVVVAERIRKAVEAQVFSSADGARIPVTLSAGVSEVAVSMPGHEELFSAADRALYRSKGEGRNRVTVAQGPSAPQPGPTPPPRGRRRRRTAP
ncbi:MAG: GGDEF domain-containing protein [Planctomycetes bacterium]|nr:GGDEF domain-containing protein [Planctomycetota bacterium]